MLRLASTAPARAIARYRYPVKQQQRFLANIKPPRPSGPPKPSEAKNPRDLPGSKTPPPAASPMTNIPLPVRRPPASTGPVTPSTIPTSPTQVPLIPPTAASPMTNIPLPMKKPPASTSPVTPSTIPTSPAQVPLTPPTSASPMTDIPQPMKKPPASTGPVTPSTIPTSPTQVPLTPPTAASPMTDIPQLAKKPLASTSPLTPSAAPTSPAQVPLTPPAAASPMTDIPLPMNKPLASTSPLTPSAAPTPPAQVPLTPPIPSPNIQTVPPTSAPAVPVVETAPPQTPPSPPLSPQAESAPPSPPPPGAKKTHRFRNFAITATLLVGLSFAGGVFYSLKSDNFHDFFTEYIPLGEDVVLYLEEREFRRRFPNALSRVIGPARPDSPKVMIPRSSGATWKVFDPEEGKTSDLGKPGGPHISAKGTEEQGKKRAETMAASKVEIKKPAPAEAKIIDEKPVPGSSRMAKVEAIEKPGKPAAPAANKDTKSAYTINAVEMKDVNDPVVQDLVKVVNSIISLVNHSGSAKDFDSVILRAKSELLHLNDQIATIKGDLEKATEEKLKRKKLELDTTFQGLLSKVNDEVTDLEHNLKEEFETEREKIVASYSERLKNELERTHKIAEQHLRNELLEQAIEMKRKFIGEIKDRVENERNGRLGRLQELSDSVDELSKLSTSWGAIIDANLKTQQMHVALEAVRAAYESPEQPKPFLRELAALEEVADDDEVVHAAIASINPLAYQVGVSTPSQLVDRFRRVAGEVRKAALLPEDAGVAGHAASWLLSKILFRKQGLAQGDDVESILTRTETFLEEGDVDSAAREMNQLQGWARRLAGDWLKEARLLLEVKQAVEVIAAEARLQSLSVQNQRSEPALKSEECDRC